jgi:hypothetical protein
MYIIMISMFYVYEIKLHIFQSLSHSIIFLSEKVSIENDYSLTFVEFTLYQPTWQATW